MNIDLQHSLDDLARSVADDATAERMTGQVGHLVGRVRRRRAARHAATGVVGATGVTALALGGMHLADLDDGAVPVGPAASPTPDRGASPTPSAEPTPAPVPTPSPSAEPEPSPTPEPTPDEPAPAPPDAAAAALASLLAAAPTGVFPACGSAVPAAAVEPLALDLALAAGPYASGQAVEATATVRTTLGRHVIANADAAGARLVVARDGVVVATVEREPSDAVLVDLAPDGTHPVALAGGLGLCATGDAAGLGLPAGEYDALGVLDAFPKEVVEASGEAYATSEPVVVVSAPVRITVG